MTSHLDCILGALIGVPALPGAKCRGRARLFDEQQPDESAESAAQRHKQAQMLCASCPSLDPCRDWFVRLRPRERPLGVIAGRLHQPKKTTAKKGTPQ